MVSPLQFLRTSGGSWGGLGGALGGLKGVFWAVLGGLGLSWDVLGGPGVVLANLGGSRGGLGRVLGQSWGGLEGVLGSLWERPGAVLGHLGTTWRHLGASWRYLDASFTWKLFCDRFLIDFMKIFRYVEHVKKDSGITKIVVLSLHAIFTLIWFRMRFWCQLVSLWPPKMHQNQVLEASWSLLAPSWGLLGPS